VVVGSKEQSNKYDIPNIGNNNSSNSIEESNLTLGYYDQFFGNDVVTTVTPGTLRFSNFQN
jgi:hypothetical protein